MKRSILVFSLFLFGGAFMNLFAQNLTELSGTVSGSDGEVLSGATVLIKDKGLGAYTDEEGKFSLKVAGNGEVVVTASFLGYASMEQTVALDGSDQSLDFTLELDGLGIGEVVVTGVINPKSKLNSSVSISTLNPQLIRESAPRNTAELLRSIPGLRSESSGGEGNTNITVRGVPISAGGAKYLQLQEDGLPILAFGDIAFGTADIFLRSDYNIKRIEAIRGGSASTLATNSPAGIVNFISQTGDIQGGAIGFTTGLDYSTYRTDFSYGSPIGDDMTYHIGGFVRTGEGPRTLGYNGNVGGQIKANFTKKFDRGYARIYYKYLNDRAAGYMPIPMQVTGTNANPAWSSVAGFDATRGSIHSPFINQNLGPGPSGELRRSNVFDGMHPNSQSIGSEFSFDLGDNWSVLNKSRMSFNSGRFVSPFPAEVGDATAIAESIAGAGASLTYVDDSSSFGGGFANNGLVTRIHMFDVELNNFNNFVNDFKIGKSFAEGKYSVSAGLFKANQNISMSWLWTSYLADVNGEKSRLLNVGDSAGNVISDNGLYAYGVPFWGNCCTRNYDVAYDLIAPYAAVELQPLENLNLDASVRWDRGNVVGSFAGAAQGAIDVNNDGNLSSPEQDVSSIDHANPTTVDYTYNYLSYSVGANYKVNEQMAIFGRYSQGGSAKADRILFSPLPYNDGSTINAKDLLSQAEVGYKARFKNVGLFVTAFYASTTEEGGFEATTQKVIENDYRAFGVELESAVNLGNFNLRVGGTWTNAQITTDGATKGNIPRRQAALIFQIIPSYQYRGHKVGFTIIGSSSAYTQDANELAMPGYAVINGFINFKITEGLTIGVNGNNLANALAITEAEEGAITDGAVNYVRARALTGRSIAASIGYRF